MSQKLNFRNNSNYGFMYENSFHIYVELLLVWFVGVLEGVNYKFLRTHLHNVLLLANKIKIDLRRASGK